MRVVLKLILQEDAESSWQEIARVGQFLERLGTVRDEPLELNRQYLGQYGRRYYRGLPISSALAESAVNALVSRRFVKKQQMRWSALGAQHLLNIRPQILNGEYRCGSGSRAANDNVFSNAA